MHGDEKSDPSIVAGKPANGDGRPKPELVEQREGAEENTGQASTRRTPSRASVSPDKLRLPCHRIDADAEQVVASRAHQSESGPRVDPVVIGMASPTTSMIGSSL